MANTNDLMTQLEDSHATIKEGQASGDQATIDKGMEAQSQVLLDNGIVYPSGNAGTNADESTPLPKSWQSSGSGSTSKSSGSSSASSLMASMVGNASALNKAAQEQQTAQIDYTVEQGVAELERAEEDAQKQFQTQQNQVDIDEAKALDNQALYAEARGDRGGIGQAQYGQIQNTAMTNRRAINTARTELATNTARQIADLRAQGEFQKADALLQLTQTYLAQLNEIQQWGAEYTLQEAQFNAQLEEWKAEFAMKESELTGVYNGQKTWEVQRTELEALAQAGVATVEAGDQPTADQLSAMAQLYGYDQAWVDARILAYQSAQENETVAAQLEKAEAALEIPGVTLSSEQRSILLAAGWTESMIAAKQKQVAQEYAAKFKTSSSTGSNTSDKSTLTYQSLYDKGLRTEGDTYAYLISSGYSSTEATALVDYYMEWIDDKEKAAEPEVETSLITATMGLGLGPAVNATLLTELADYGAITEDSRGVLHWATGWSASNYKTRLAAAKTRGYVLAKGLSASGLPYTS